MQPLKCGGDYRSARTFDDLRRQIDPAYAASQRFAEVQRELAGFVASGAAAQTQANAVMEIARSRYLGIATAAEAAEEAQRQQAAAVAQATGDYQALRASLDPVYAASKRYEASVETLTAAVAQGVITQQTMNRTLAMAQTQFLAPANGLRGIAGAADQAKTGISRFTPAITSAGFQIQDFAVQVASGQSAMIAFTQQFPQLAGALGMSGNLALIGVGLGTLVAVGMAVAPMFFDIGKTAQTAEEAVDDLTGSMNSYTASVQNAILPMGELWRQFGVGAAAARDTYAALMEIERIELLKGMQATTGALASDLQVIADAAAAITLHTSGAAVNAALAQEQAYIATQKLNDEFKLTGDVALRVNGAMDDLSKADGPRLQADAAARLGRELMRAYEAGGSTNGVLLRAAESAFKLSIDAGKTAVNLERGVPSANAVAVAVGNVSLRMAEATGFAAQLVATIGRVPAAMAAIGGEVDGIISGLARQNTTLQYQLTQGISASAASVKALRDDAISAAQASGASIDELARLGETFAPQIAEAERLAISIGSANTELAEMQKVAAAAGQSVKSSGGAAKSATAEIDKLTQSLNREAEQWRDLLDPMTRYRRDATELAKLTGILSRDDMAKAQRNLNIELADSLPLAGEFVDLMSTGLLNGFSGTLSSMADALKKWLANAIAMAAKNRIVIAMGLGGLGARTITGTVLPAGYIRTDADTVAVYDGTRWVVDRQIENGSNANGFFQRTADGTQICSARVTVSTSGEVGAVFPAAFSGTADLRVVTGVNGAAARVLSARFTSLTAGGVEFSCFTSADIRVAVAVEYMALGRWY